MRTDTRFVRARKAETILKLHEEICKKDSLSCQTFHNGIVLPLFKFENDPLLFGRGGCLNEKQEYIALSGIRGRIWGSYPVNQDKLEYSAKSAIYCGYLIRHWGHFLLEAITRLWFALEHQNEYDEFVFFTELDSEYKLEGNYLQFFELLGISEKIRIVNKPTQFTSLVIPEMAYQCNQYWSESYKSTLETISKNACAISANKEFPEKVFLSRAKFLKKKYSQEFGIDMLDDYFSSNGYTVLYPEEIGLKETIQYLRHAKICSAESGSCAHNMVFAAQGAKIEIIERSPFVNDMQADIDVIRDFRVTYVDAYYAFYPVRDAGGPYLLFFTEQFRQYTRENDYKEPDKKYLTEKYKADALTWYINSYRYRNGNAIIMNESIARFYPVFSEAIEESNKVFAKYLHADRRYIIWYKIKRRVLMILKR